MTDAQLGELAFGTDLATAAQAVTDAEAVYAFVTANPAATDAALAQWSVAQWGADDAASRQANALAVLGLQNRVVDIQA